MRVYGHRGSICTNRVLFALAEKGREAELVVVDLAKGEHRAAAHVARQPFGVIPVLEDEAGMLYESRAIMRYVADLPGPRLVPETARARAEMEQWISVEQSYVAPPVSAILQQKFLAPMRGAPVDMAVVDAARAQLATALDVLDAALAGRRYLAGDALSLAEISLAPVFGMIHVLDEQALLAPRRAVSAWWERIAARPTWVRIAS
jgi:glutathione S-transferase